mgnify:CR=1 FL=1
MTNPYGPSGPSNHSNPGRGSGQSRPVGASMPGGGPVSGGERGRVERPQNEAPRPRSPRLIVGSIIGVLVVMARRVPRARTLLAIALLAGGAVGNLIDRLTAEPGFGVGHVTDFIAYGTWFVGNVADIWIVLGAPLLALALSREPSKEDAQ